MVLEQLVLDHGISGGQNLKKKEKKKKEKPTTRIYFFHSCWQLETCREVDH